MKWLTDEEVTATQVLIEKILCGYRRGDEGWSEIDEQTLCFWESGVDDTYRDYVEGVQQ